MSQLPARNRVIYQSEALFVSPDTTGHHLFYKSNFQGSTNSSMQSECWITGTDNIGDSIFFNVCNGDYSHTDPSTTVVFENANNTILDQNKIGNSTWHPILSKIGFNVDASITGPTAALQHLKILDNPIEGSWGTTVSQLKRVQSADYSFTINRQDVNEFGKLGRTRSVVVEAPTVNLNFSYYLTDGENERLLGFNTHEEVQFTSGIMSNHQNDLGNNFFILTVPEGRDAVSGDVGTDNENQTVIGVGNAYIVDYNLEASVGSFPTCNVSVEGSNIRSDVGTFFKSLPGIDPQNIINVSESKFFLPKSEAGSGAGVLRPGDISIKLNDSALISKQVFGESLSYDAFDNGSAHIQSFALSVPMPRTELQIIGNTYPYAKEIDSPIRCSLTINALVADLKAGNLSDLLCGETYDITIKMRHAQCVGCTPSNASDSFLIHFRGAFLDSESFSSSIGNNKSVDLTFNAQLASPSQKDSGIFFMGSENSLNNEGQWRLPPNVVGNKYHKYGSPSK